MHIIKSATHEMLIESGNTAYIVLLNRTQHAEQRTQLAEQRLVQQRYSIYANVQFMTQIISSSMNDMLTRAISNLSSNSRTDPPNTIPSTSLQPTLPQPALQFTLPQVTCLPALLEDDYPDIDTWSKSDWDTLQTRSNTPPNTWGFLTDENGIAVSEDRISAMGVYIRGLFNELYAVRLDPQKWSKLGDRVSQYIESSMGAKFPEFRYCSDGWKLREFAGSRFREWNKNSRVPGRLSRMFLFLYH